jgi:hypothetical protein
MAFVYSRHIENEMQLTINHWREMSTISDNVITFSIMFPALVLSTRVRKSSSLDVGIERKEKLAKRIVYPYKCRKAEQARYL